MGGELTRRDFVAAVGGAAAAAYAGQGAPAEARGVARPGHDALRYYYPLPRGRRRVVETDVCVYGATAGGVAAAVQAARMGRSVALAAFGRHLGGMSSAGLGATDAGNSVSIGGLGREFYRRVGAHYGEPASFRFEPHVAEAVFDELGRRARRRRCIASSACAAPAPPAGADRDPHGGQHRLPRRGLHRRDVRGRPDGGGRRVVRRRPRGQRRLRRDAQRRPGPRTTISSRCRSTRTSTPGDPASGLLPGIAPDPPGTPGEGDHRIQAYNFRLCLTRAPDRLPFPRPPGYDPAAYELLLRYIGAGVWDGVRAQPIPMPGGKTDMNNNGAVVVRLHRPQLRLPGRRLRGGASASSRTT